MSPPLELKWLTHTITFSLLMMNSPSKGFLDVEKAELEGSNLPGLYDSWTVPSAPNEAEVANVALPPGRSTNVTLSERKRKT